MKCCLSFILLLLSTLIAQGQNCDAMAKKPLFSGKIFGSPIPADLARCSTTKPLTNGNYSTLRVCYDRLQLHCRQEYASLFTWESVRFAFLQLGANKKGKVLAVDLYSFFDDVRPPGASIYTPPANFTKLYQKLLAQYGKPNEIKQPTKTDSLLIKDAGMPLVFGWNCGNITFTLRVVYGAHNKDLNILHLRAVNYDFDVIPDAEKKVP